MTTGAITPTQTTDRELDDLAWRLCEAVFGSDVKCIPEYEPATEDFYAAAREADHWARDRYAASRELLRQHAEMTERMKELDAAHDRAASLADRVMVAEGERDSYIALYVRVLQYAADTEDRLASLSDESAEAEAERYRRLYAQTLRSLESWQQARDEAEKRADDWRVAFLNMVRLAREFGHEAEQQEKRVAKLERRAERAELQEQLLRDAFRRANEEVQHGE